MYSNAGTEHMLTLKTQFEVTQGPANIFAREVFILPGSKLQSNEDIKTAACW